MAWIIIVSKNARHAVCINNYADDRDDISIFGTFSEAKACADIQPLCKAYGGWYLDLDTGETRAIEITT